MTDLDITPNEQATPGNPNPAAAQDGGQLVYRQLREDVQSGKVGWRAALEFLSSPKSKPWKTAAWKKRRDQIIGTRCSQCESTTPPFVLQHTWQPTRLVDLFKAVRAEHQEEWLRWQQLNPFPADLPSLIPDADACPTCGSQTIVFRKRASTWVCKRIQNGVAVCGAVFSTPIRVISKEAQNEARKAIYLAHRDRFDDESGVGKEVIIRSIDEHLRYMSLKDTTTYCKRCAFRQDQLSEVLCQTCGKHYHSVRYKQCYTCSQGLQSQ